MLAGPEKKELFSMAGLMPVKEFFKRTDEEALDRYNADLLVQYALNIDQEGRDFASDVFPLPEASGKHYSIQLRLSAIYPSFIVASPRNAFSFFHGTFDTTKRKAESFNFSLAVLI